MFGPLASAWRKVVDEVSRTSIGVIRKHNFISCYARARKSAFTTSNMISSWRRTGIYPLNREIIPKTAYAPAKNTTTQAAQPVAAAIPAFVQVIGSTDESVNGSQPAGAENLVTLDEDIDSLTLGMESLTMHRDGKEGDIVGMGALALDDKAGKTDKQFTPLPSIVGDNEDGAAGTESIALDDEAAAALDAEMDALFGPLPSIRGEDEENGVAGVELMALDNEAAAALDAEMDALFSPLPSIIGEEGGAAGLEPLTFNDNANAGLIAELPSTMGQRESGGVDQVAPVLPIDSLTPASTPAKTSPPVLDRTTMDALLNVQPLEYSRLPQRLGRHATRQDLRTQNEELRSLCAEALTTIARNYALQRIMDFENARLRTQLFEKNNKKTKKYATTEARHLTSAENMVALDYWEWEKCVKDVFKSKEFKAEYKASKKGYQLLCKDRDKVRAVLVLAAMVGEKFGNGECGHSLRDVLLAGEGRGRGKGRTRGGSRGGAGRGAPRAARGAGPAAPRGSRGRGRGGGQRGGQRGRGRGGGNQGARDDVDSEGEFGGLHSDTESEGGDDGVYQPRITPVVRPRPRAIRRTRQTQATTALEIDQDNTHQNEGDNEILPPIGE